jgi:hypothetical protein
MFLRFVKTVYEKGFHATNDVAINGIFQASQKRLSWKDPFHSSADHDVAIKLYIINNYV